MHMHAFSAAEAAEAARAQGKYWEYAALLYANRASLTTEKLGQFASQLGLDRPTFDSALETGTYAGRVARDMRDGWRVGVVGTPWFFVNGEVVSRYIAAGLRAAVEAALASSPR